MPFNDNEWKLRNPECFKTMGAKSDVECECGEVVVKGGFFRGTQDHPWRPPRVECDCGKIHQITGLPCDCEEMVSE